MLWQAAKLEVVEEMARLLTSAGMQDVLPLGKARVPVVKCIVPETGTQVSPPPSPTHVRTFEVRFVFEHTPQDLFT